MMRSPAASSSPLRSGTVTTWAVPQSMARMTRRSEGYFFDPFSSMPKAASASWPSSSTS